MFIKLVLKKISPAWLLKAWRSYRYKPVDDRALPDDKLMSLMRHEAHRIEKTIYNDILESKYDIYQEKKFRVDQIIKILISRGYEQSHPVIDWAFKISNSFDDLEASFISVYSKTPEPLQLSKASEFSEFLQRRRSVRVWAENQPDSNDLEVLALKVIDAARWAPTSGNRQPWRFKILTNDADKDLLAGIKENHCTSAPICIFVGMDTRLYGAFSDRETGIYIDAGAAIQNMILCAHSTGLGTCWNHFATDLIQSREANVKSYAVFTARLNIPDYIEPIAVVAIGYPEFIPPTPARMDVTELIL